MTLVKSPEKYRYWNQLYLANRLSDTEKQEFEYFLLENPQAASELEIDTVFHEVLPTLQQSNDSAATKCMAWLRGVFLTPLRASSVTFCLCLLAYIVSYPNNNVAGLASSHIAYLETLRSASSEAPTYTMPSDSDSLALMVQTYFAMPSDTYNVAVVENATANTVFEQQVKGNEYGELLIVLGRKYVREGAYTVVVSPVDDMAGTASQEFAFNLNLD